MHSKEYPHMKSCNVFLERKNAWLKFELSCILLWAAESASPRELAEFTTTVPDQAALSSDYPFNIDNKWIIWFFPKTFMTHEFMIMSKSMD